MDGAHETAEGVVYADIHFPPPAPPAALQQLPSFPWCGWLSAWLSCASCSWQRYSAWACTVSMGSSQSLSPHGPCSTRPTWPLGGQDPAQSQSQGQLSAGVGAVQRFPED
ncbi:unnamed protein product [Caretta caretta]